MNRNLDGYYFRVKRDGKWDNVCWSDMTDEERDEQMTNRSEEWLKSLCKGLGCVPFLIVFGWTWQLIVIFISHLIIDSLKARWNRITYTEDQTLHYIIGMIYLID